jgi:hypothetical protein
LVAASPATLSADRDDPVAARRVVNGTDRAALIADHYRSFRAALEAAALAAEPVGWRTRFAAWARRLGGCR